MAEHANYADLKAHTQQPAHLIRRRQTNATQNILWLRLSWPREYLHKRNKNSNKNSISKGLKYLNLSYPKDDSSFSNWNVPNRYGNKHKYRK